MFSLSPSTLLLVETEQDGRNIRQVRILDCSISPPKLIDSVLSKIPANSIDACVVERGDKNLAVFAHEDLSAYDMNTGELEWTVKKIADEYDYIKTTSVTTDGHGNLYVCRGGDSQKGYIGMISPYGVFIKIIVKYGEQGLGEPKWIRWCEQTQSVIVAHGGDRVSVINTT